MVDETRRRLLTMGAGVATACGPIAAGGLTHKPTAALCGSVKVLMEEVYSRHVCRLDPWPEPVQRCFRTMNAKIYNIMQGPDEFNITGAFRHWDIWDRLSGINVPTLLIAARYDEMSPEQIQRMGTLIPHARVSVCERGSHMAMYDDQRAYFDALIPFLQETYRNQ
jgi:proline iminopeptidase